MIEERTLNSDGTPVNTKYNYIYANKGNIIEANEYSSSGSLEYKYTYKYDDKRNLIEKKQYQSYKDGSLMDTDTIKSDVKGNLIEVNSDDLFYHKKFMIIYKYDNRGNVSECSNYSNGELTSKTIYKYDNYDSKGNWLIKNEYHNDSDNPYTITEREIEYYSK